MQLLYLGWNNKKNNECYVESSQQHCIFTQSALSEKFRLAYSSNICELKLCESFNLQKWLQKEQQLAPTLRIYALLLTILWQINGKTGNLS